MAIGSFLEKNIRDNAKKTVAGITESDNKTTSPVSGITNSPQEPVIQEVKPVEPIGAPKVEQPKIEPITPVPEVKPVEVKPISFDMPVAPSVAPSVVPTPVAPEQIDTAPTPKTEVAPPPTRGIDTKELERLSKERFEAQKAQIEEQAAVSQQNVRNLFSHLTATGKDSGFINSMNMASARSANRTARDELFRHNTSFMNEMYNIAQTKAAQDADFNEAAYTNWVESGNEQIEQLAQTGDFEGAAAIASQYAELDGNYNFTKWTNPAYVDSFKKSFDKAARQDFNVIMDQVNNIAASAEIGGVNYNRTLDTIVANINTSDLGLAEMTNYIGSVDEAEYEGFGISSENKEILRQVKSGQRDMNDPVAQKAYADLLARETQDSLNKANMESRLGNAKQLYQGNPLGLSIIDTIIQDTGGPIEWEPTEGFDVNRFSVFGNSVDLSQDPSAVERIPGLDIYFKDVNNQPYTNIWTKEMADKQEVDGLPQNQGYYTDLYQQYIKKKTAEYESASDLEKSSFKVNNFDQFLDQLRKSDFDTGATKEEMINAVESGVEDELLVKPETMDKYRDEYEAILAADNINDVGLSTLTLKNMLAEGDVTEDLMREGKITQISLGTTGRNDFFNDPTSALYGDKGIDFIRTLNDNNEGYVADSDGTIYRVKAEPDRYKPGESTWRPTIKYTFEPIDSKGTYYYGVGRYPESLQKPVTGGSNYGSDSKTNAMNTSRALFNAIKGE